MAKQFASVRNLRFLLHEVFNVEEMSQYPYFSDYNREAIDMALDAAYQLAEKALFPYMADQDRHEPTMENGVVKVHPQIKNQLKAMGDGGWIAGSAPYEYGGMQMPEQLVSAAGSLFQAANNGVAYIGLTAGAARLIVSFGTEEQKQTYAPHMYSGRWQGTMCLTEPQAGSALSDVVTSATPVDAATGLYKIYGQKIYISAGDHDACDNVVHLVLARIKGAPAGTKGISLFVVPKFRPEGDQLVPNDVTSAGLYHKLGQHATPALHLEFGYHDNCEGYLLGEPNKGLSYMFQMMNEARIGVGIVGASVSGAAYHASLEYANERTQGRRLNSKNPTEPPTLIINHPDVRRMLFFQQAVVEGSLGLLIETSRYLDLVRASTDHEEKAKYELLLDILTPIAKTFPTEYGILSTSNGLQCLGGYGFTVDFPLEQLYRDIRITTIYEGTTGIQSLDLLGRKVTMQNGRAAVLLFEEIGKTMAEAAEYDALKPYTKKLRAEMGRIQEVTNHLMQFAKQGDNERFLMDANLYMEMFSLAVIGWQWIKQATVAQRALLMGGNSPEEQAFYEGKIHTMKYFFHYEIPKTLGLAARLMDDEVLTIIKEEQFA